jgi:hypothetical protein
MFQKEEIKMLCYLFNLSSIKTKQNLRRRPAGPTYNGRS